MPREEFQLLFLLRSAIMKSENIKKILAGVQTVVLVAGITVANAACHNQSKCSACKSTATMQQPSGPNEPNSSCGKGSCGKGSCSKGSCSK
jgi:hypothetical protein